MKPHFKYIIAHCLPFTKSNIINIVYETYLTRLDSLLLMSDSSFKFLNIKKKYDSDEREKQDYILQNFYIPCLSRTIEYSRLTGFFTSTSLSVTSRGIANLITNGGRMRLVTSPRLSQSDKQAIADNVCSESEVIERSLIREIFENNIVANKHVEALGWMIANNILEIRLAIILDEENNSSDVEGTNDFAMFHTKIGIMTDNHGNRISFSGSINETKTGWTRNIESFDVFCEWKSSDQEEYLQGHVNEFEKYWKLGDNGRCRTIAFPKNVENLWTEGVTSDLKSLKIFKKSQNEEEKERGFSLPSGFKLRDYQEKAVESWAGQEYRGLFDMATGTGKTSTAIAAALRLYEDKNQEICIIVACPFLHLVEMWVEEFRLFGVDGVIETHSQSKNWKRDLSNKIRLYNTKGKFFVVATTINTFSTKYFQNALESIKGDVLLISDEVHRMGTGSYSKGLSDKIRYRLGLSATIDRWNDPSGTNRLLKYFGERCIVYDLKKAMDQGMLTPYMYYPIPCYYSDEEYERIVNVNRTIDELSSYGGYANRALIQKEKVNGVRIMAQMEDKMVMLIKVLQNYKDKHHMLIYCGDARVNSDDIDEDTGNINGEERMVEHVSRRVYSECQMDLRKFTYERTLDERKDIIEDFTNKNLQALIAIRCLDEGVNIPNIRTAFILSSSENPKEYIQRRGRVLRLAEGKNYAEIYDFLALPKSASYHSYISDKDDMDLRLAARELKRVYEFMELSTNKEYSTNLIEKIAKIYNVGDIESYVRNCE